MASLELSLQLKKNTDGHTNTWTSYKLQLGNGWAKIFNNPAAQQGLERVMWSVKLLDESLFNELFLLFNIKISVFGFFSAVHTDKWDLKLGQPTGFGISLTAAIYFNNIITLFSQKYVSDSQLRKTTSLRYGFIFLLWKKREEKEMHHFPPYVHVCVCTCVRPSTGILSHISSIPNFRPSGVKAKP